MKINCFIKEKVQETSGPSRKSSKDQKLEDDGNEKMKSNAAHIFVISPENVTIR